MVVCGIYAEVKLLMELYKQMTPEALSAPRFNNEPEGQLSSGAPSKHELPSGVSGQNQQASMVKIKRRMLLEDQLLAGTSSPFPAWNQSIMV